MNRQLLAGLLVVSALQAGASPAQAQDPLRVLIVGDSVTQGSVGDWTWRYRLWQQFAASGVPVDLVGPRDDLHDVDTDQSGSHAYLDPGFDTDHAARWGMKLADMDTPIGDLVATYHPDVVVELLGVNDLGYDHTSPAVVEDLLRSFVADAQAADPGVDVVLGALPQRWIGGVPEVDAALPGLAAALDHGDGRVVATDIGAGFGPEDVWDGGHPSATGELKVAVSVAAALARLGIPVAFPDPPPPVENGPPDPAALTVVAGDGTATLSWVPPLGATHEYLWLRDATEGADWIRLYFPVTGTTWTAEDLVDGHHYQFRLQATKGTAVAEHVFSNVADAFPAPPPPGPVATLAVTPLDHGLEAAWSAADRASRYEVRWWPVEAPDEVVSSLTTGLGATITGLRAGRRYAVSVEPLADWVPGPVAAAVGVPSGLVPAAVVPTARVDRQDRVHLVWASVENATSYRVDRLSVAGTRWRSVPEPPGRHVFLLRAYAEDVAGPRTRVAVTVR